MPKPLRYRLYNEDCRETCRNLKANSIDTIITDPPYGLSFMEKDWDHGIPGVSFWTRILRVTKPGGILLAFGGTRTSHRLVCAIEDAGWEIRDSLMWLYGSGFPKSLNIGKAIDKAAGAEREVIGKNVNDRPESQVKGGKAFDRALDKGQKHQSLLITTPATEAAKLWDGWGTSLKPAYEPIVLAMKPLEGTFAANALEHGVAGLNVDGSRIGIDGTEREIIDRRSGSDDGEREGIYHDGVGKRAKGEKFKSHNAGRWPANLILDEEAGAMLDEQSGTLQSGSNCTRTKEGFFGEHGGLGKAGDVQITYGNSGGASRFFYCAKSSKKERNLGLGDLPVRPAGGLSGRRDGSLGGEPVTAQNHHPTVKPLKLMEYLCTLTKTPTGGIVFDPFMGSGTTGIACANTGRKFIGCENDTEHGYFQIALQRIRNAYRNARET